MGWQGGQRGANTLVGGSPGPAINGGAAGFPGLGRGEAGRRGVLAGLCSAGLVRAALADGPPVYPDWPVRVIVPFAPGGANDILGRLFCARLGQRFGQSFVPENRTGAQGIVGTELVARARPDGHTLLIGASGPLVFNPVIYETLPYDPQRDLAPIAMLGSYPLLLVVPSSSPHRTVGGLVEWARTDRDGGTYGAANAAFQLASELLNRRVGTRFVYVGYRGNAEVSTAVAAGDLTMALLDSGPAASALATGRVRALAALTAQRPGAWPEVPTMAEAGFSQFEVSFWCGLVAPAGTPPAILAALQEGVAEVARDAQLRQRMAALSIEPASGSSEEFGRTIAAETVLWRDVARQSNLRFER